MLVLLEGTTCVPQKNYQVVQVPHRFPMTSLARIAPFIAFLTEALKLLDAWSAKAKTWIQIGNEPLGWAIYNDLSRGHPKWWFGRKGIPPKHFYFYPYLGK